MILSFNTYNDSYKTVGINIQNRLNYQIVCGNFLTYLIVWIIFYVTVISGQPKNYIKGKVTKKLNYKEK